MLNTEQNRPGDHRRLLAHPHDAGEIPLLSHSHKRTFNHHIPSPNLSIWHTERGSTHKQNDTEAVPSRPNDGYNTFWPGLYGQKSGSAPNQPPSLPIVTIKGQEDSLGCVEHESPGLSAETARNHAPYPDAHLLSLHPPPQARTVAWNAIKYRRNGTLRRICTTRPMEWINAPILWRGQLSSTVIG